MILRAFSVAFAMTATFAIITAVAGAVERSFGVGPSIIVFMFLFLFALGIGTQIVLNDKG